MYSANKKEVHTKDVPVHEKDQSKANKKEVHTKDVPVHEKYQSKAKIQRKIYHT